MGNSNSDFDDDELAMLTKLERETEASDPSGPARGDEDEDDPQAAAGATSGQTTTDEPAKGTPAADKQQQEQQTDPAKEAAVKDEPKGDVRAALRAARRSERRALTKVEELEAEVEALKKAAPAAAKTDDDIQIDETLERDFPAVAKPLKVLKAKLDEANRELAELKKKPTSQAQDDEFVPPVLPAAVQDAVDDVPELLEWQTSAEGQDKWAMAVQADNLLRNSPKWKDKPLAARLTEAVRRVKAELGDEPASTTTTPSKDKPRVDPKEAIAKAGRKEAPVTLSDLRGGDAAQHNQAMSRRSMETMSDDEILNSLG